MGLEEMAQKSRALSSLSEGPGLEVWLLAHVMTHNPLQRQFQEIWCPLLASRVTAGVWYTYM